MTDTLFLPRELFSPSVPATPVLPTSPEVEAEVHGRSRGPSAFRSGEAVAADLLQAEALTEADWLAAAPSHERRRHPRRDSAAVDILLPELPR